MAAQPSPLRAAVLGAGAGALATVAALGLRARLAEGRRRHGGPAVKIDGKKVAEQVLADIKAEVQVLQAEHGVTPGLAVVLVGDRTDSATYVRMKKKAAAEVGFHSVDVSLPATASQADIVDAVQKLNADKSVHAILVQLPLPDGVDESVVLNTIRVEKDADGFLPQNIGDLWLKGGRPPLALPCTPAGCIELLQRSDVQVSGKNVVIVGRSNIVGMPVSGLLLSMNATITICHSRTVDIEKKVREADVVVAAIGKAEFVKGSWIKPGAVVIDVGINRKDDSTRKSGYRLVGDVDYAEASQRASAITPVPGGVGPMTVAMLCKNTVNLARHSVGMPRIPLRKSPSHVNVSQK